MKLTLLRTTKGESPQGLWPQKTALIPPDWRNSTTSGYKLVGIPPSNRDSTTTERRKHAGVLVRQSKASPPRLLSFRHNGWDLKSFKPLWKKLFISFTHSWKPQLGGSFVPSQVSPSAGERYRICIEGIHLIASFGIPQPAAAKSPHQLDWNDCLDSSSRSFTLVSFRHKTHQNTQALASMYKQVGAHSSQQNTFFQVLEYHAILVNWLQKALHHGLSSLGHLLILMDMSTGSKRFLFALESLSEFPKKIPNMFTQLNP